MLNDSEEDFDFEQATAEELEEYFSYKYPPTKLHKQLIEHWQGYIEENEKMMRKKNRAAGRRARGHLLQLEKLILLRRKEMLAEYKTWSYGE